MPTSIDSLQIEINAKAVKANTAIDQLVVKMDRLSASLSRVNGSNLIGIANGLDRIGRSMQTMSTINSTNISLATKNIRALSNVSSANLNAISTSLSKVSASLSGLKKINSSVQGISQLANAIRQLGYKTATQAITNIPLLAKAMRELMVELSKAPKVSRNIIDMTNALARLSRTGANSGRAISSASRGLNVYSASANRATKSTKSLASAIGKVYASYWLLFRAFTKIKNAMNMASELTEVQNLTNVVFGDMVEKIEKVADTSIESFGMSERTFKRTASIFQSMLKNLDVDRSSIRNANEFLNTQTNGYVELSDSMADVSLTLTKLTADMESLYGEALGVTFDDVADDLKAIITGESKPLRLYGLDLRDVTIQTWAMSQGLDSNVKTMTQAEKAMLRYQYVLAHTSEAQNDFKLTSESWANQIRILKQNFEQLAIIIGKTFVASLKPVVIAINNAMSSILKFAETVYQALGKIFGWKPETGRIADDLGEGGVGAGEIEDGLGGAVQNAKELNKQLGKFDELNVINTSPKTDSSGGGTGGDVGGISDVGDWVRTDGILDEFKSEIDSLYELGEYINQVLTDTLKGIDWESIYENARGFGKGLADFFNGLISPELFGEVGKTIANSLNTAIYASLSFAETFDFEEFGESLANGVNNFFTNFDFVALGQSINTWCNGIITAIKSFFANLSFSDVFSGLSDMLKEFDLSTITVIVGAFTFKHMKSVLTKGILASVLTKKLGMGSAGMSMSFPLKIMLSAISVAATFDFGTRFGEEIGKLIYGDNEYYHLNPAELMKELYNTFATGEGDNPFEKIVSTFKDAWNGMLLEEKDRTNAMLDGIAEDLKSQGASPEIVDLELARQKGELTAEEFKTGLETALQNMSQEDMDFFGITEEQLELVGKSYGINITDGIENGLNSSLSKQKDFSPASNYLTGDSATETGQTYGAGIVSGMNKGINEQKRTTASTLNSYMNDINKNIHDSVLQFGSPSKKTEAYGKDTVLGFNNGVTKNQKQTYAVVRAYMNSIANTFKQNTSQFVEIGKLVGQNINKGLQEEMDKISEQLQKTVDKLKEDLNKKQEDGKNTANKPENTVKSIAPTTSSVASYVSSYAPKTYDNAQTNALLVQLIDAVNNKDMSVELDGRKISKSVQRQDTLERTRTGKGLFEKGGVPI